MPSNVPGLMYPKQMYFIVLLLIADWRSRQRERCAGSFISSLRRVFRGRSGPGCLLVFAGSLTRSRVEKHLAHLARRTAGDGTLARPRECLVHISGFKYPETAHVLLGLQVRPVG